MSARVEGLDRVLGRLRRLPAAMGEARTETLETWEQETTGAAQERAPVRTGRLKEHIEGKVDADRGVAEVGVWDGEALEYAEYVEKGTSSMEAQPFLVPAFEATRGDVARRYRAAVGRRLEG